MSGNNNNLFLLAAPGDNLPDTTRSRLGLWLRDDSGLFPSSCSYFTYISSPSLPNACPILSHGEWRMNQKRASLRRTHTESLEPRGRCTSSFLIF